MKYKFTKENGEVVYTEPERWIWGALYNDGTELHQYDKDGNYHQLKEIKQDELKLFSLYKPNTDHRIDIIMQPGMRIIHKYRHVISKDMTGGEETRKKYYIFGYRHGNERDYKYHFNYILPNDTVIQSNEDNIDLTKFNV